MKWLIVLFLVLGFNAKSQNNDLINLCYGSVVTFDILKESLGKFKVHGIVKSTGEKKEFNSVIMSDKKDGSTVVTIKYNDSCYISMGYAPSLDLKRNFNGSGYFCMVINQNNNIKEVYNYKAPLMTTTYGGEVIEKLNYLGAQVLISEKVEVVGFILEDISYVMPSNYFEY